MKILFLPRVQCSKKHFLRALLVLLLPCFCFVNPVQGKVLSTQGMSIALFPVLNNTPQKVWPTKYYPGDIIPQKVGEYARAYLLDSPFVDLTVLDESGMARWFSGEKRFEDLGILLEIYRFDLHKNTTLGSKYGASVSLRIYLYDSFSGEKIYSQTYSSKDSRWTPEFRPDTWLSPQGQKVATYWQSFEQSPYWAALKKATQSALSDIVRGYPGYHITGRILSPTKDSTKKKPKYIVSLGKRHSLRLGDVLGVARSDTYITVSPEDPVVLVPEIIGKVRVVFLKEEESVVEVVTENEAAPIKLRDVVVVPLFGPRKGEW